MTIPPPYPGWPIIRDRIREMVAGAGEVSRISGCMLRYTDLIPVDCGGALPGSEDIVRLLSGRFDCSLSAAQVVRVQGVFPGTEGAVSSLSPMPGRPVWTLIFSMETAGHLLFVSEDSTLNWFDDARDGIHMLFDLIVPDNIVQSLR